ncbi:hypothetical protein RvY_01434 [Ramazzottius varieornatus]|uniref:Uncharacterized protein n=1 Tax=Ramazzottius varieornatus TaxID=947166 RepID=A0A1D1UJU7_RAMVA|nr:hypothetical protein RvY_01434 [Ramazzottius varieornatus]
MERLRDKMKPADIDYRLPESHVQTVTTSVGRRVLGEAAVSTIK